MTGTDAVAAGRERPADLRRHHRDQRRLVPGREGRVLRHHRPQRSGQDIPAERAQRGLPPASGKCQFAGEPLLGRKPAQHRVPGHRPDLPEPRVVRGDDGPGQRGAGPPPPHEGGRPVRRLLVGPGTPGGARGPTGLPPAARAHGSGRHPRAARPRPALRGQEAHRTRPRPGDAAHAAAPRRARGRHEHARDQRAGPMGAHGQAGAGSDRRDDRARHGVGDQGRRPRPGPGLRSGHLLRHPPGRRLRPAGDPRLPRAAAATPSSNGQLPACPCPLSTPTTEPRHDREPADPDIRHLPGLHPRPARPRLRGGCQGHRGLQSRSGRVRRGRGLPDLHRAPHLGASLRPGSRALDRVGRRVRRGPRGRDRAPGGGHQPVHADPRHVRPAHRSSPRSQPGSGAPISCRWAIRGGCPSTPWGG